LQAEAAHRHMPIARILWIVALAVMAFGVATHVGELRQVWRAIQAADRRYLVAATGIEIVFVLNLALFYTSTFRASRVKATHGRFLLLTTASHFVNIISKSGGLGGIALYLREGRRFGESSVRITAAYLTAYVLGYVAYFAVLITALILLYLRGSLQTAEVAASLAILGIVVVSAVIMVAGLRSEAALERLYLLAARPLNMIARLLRRAPFVDRETAIETVRELYDAVTHVKRNPAAYIVPFAHALLVEVVSVATLYVVARSLHAEVRFETALVGYAVSLLFAMVAVTPGGVGFVEASLGVLLVSFGVDRHTAIAVALVYRFYEFWIPLALGAIALQLLREPTAAGVAP
jgi:uncharacterized protein (TIRG00374 family)